MLVGLHELLLDLQRFFQVFELALLSVDVEVAAESDQEADAGDEEVGGGEGAEGRVEGLLVDRVAQERHESGQDGHGGEDLAHFIRVDS